MSYPKLLYEYKNTTLVQPEVGFGVYPPSQTEKKLISRHVCEYLIPGNFSHPFSSWNLRIDEFLRQKNQIKWPKLKEFVQEQY